MNQAVKDYSEVVHQLVAGIREDRRNPRIVEFFHLCNFTDAAARYLDINFSEKVGCTRTMMAILLALIWNGGTMPQKRIAGVVYRTKQATAFALESLAEEGFVERGASSQDRRVRVITITEEGVTYFQKNVSVIQAMCRETMSCLTEAELKQFATITGKLRSNLSGLVEASVVSEESEDERSRSRSHRKLASLSLKA